MAHNPFNILTLEALRAPLNPTPITLEDVLIDGVRVKYRTYHVEYNINDGAVLLPRMFEDDFSDEIGRLAKITDTHGNTFEVLVHKVNDNVYLTKGWAALKDFYNIQTGAWLMLMYIGMGNFNMTLQNRLHEIIVPPTFVPPARFVIDKYNVPTQFDHGVPDSAELLSYSHDASFFHFLYDKALDYFDISGGFLTLPYDGFGEYAFHITTNALKLVDDSGNSWNCTISFNPTPTKHFRIGGEWGVMVAARRLSLGDVVRVGVSGVGKGETLYFELDPYKCI